jgi:hypothetical protein
VRLGGCTGTIGLLIQTNVALENRPSSSILNIQVYRSGSPDRFLAFGAKGLDESHRGRESRYFRCMGF